MYIHIFKTCFSAGLSSKLANHSDVTAIRTGVESPSSDLKLLT